DRLEQFFTRLTGHKLKGFGRETLDKLKRYDRTYDYSELAFAAKAMILEYLNEYQLSMESVSWAV
ncbi:MAG: hypothetical protein HQL11_06730, partial [Candidatus Omnitrophica bacterium]|nr:hypothetical protein [Candidatus Omnitrophota bacterium]